MQSAGSEVGELEGDVKGVPIGKFAGFWGGDLAGFQVGERLEFSDELTIA